MAGRAEDAVLSWPSTRSRKGTTSYAAMKKAMSQMVMTVIVVPMSHGT